MLIQFLFAAIIVPLFIGCSKDKQEVIGNDWQIESLKEHTDSIIKYPTATYMLTFENKRNYTLYLDVNSCFGKVNFKRNNKIEFESDGCSKMCCGSDFAEKLVVILNKINQYTLNNNILTLSGDKDIIINLKRK